MTFPRWALWILLLCAALPAAARAQPAASPGAQGSPQILFEQPMLGGIAGNFHVPPAEHKYPADKPFNLVLWQPNPTRPDGQLVPTDWKAGDRTGFYPAAPLLAHQAAFRNAAGASTVQIDGGTVGVYLNSHDLPKGSPGNKMMIRRRSSLLPSSGSLRSANPLSHSPIRSNYRSRLRATSIRRETSPMWLRFLCSRIVGPERRSAMRQFFSTIP